jgi:hypothetical protein
MRCEIDNSKIVRFEKESYHAAIMQDGHTVFLDSNNAKELVKLLETQGLLD